MTDTPGGASSGLNEPIISSRTGRWLRLLPIGTADYEFLYALALADPNDFHWRFPAAPPSGELFRQHLSTGLLAKFIVGERKRGIPIGLVVAHNQNLVSGTAHIASSFESEVHGSGVVVEAFELFLHHLFDTWDLRKVYFEVPEYDLTNRMNAPNRTLLRQEGRLRQHLYRDGHWWDQLIFALYREEFAQISTSRRERVIKASEAVDTAN